MNWFQLLEHAANGGALLVHLTIKATVLLLLSFAVVTAMRRSSASLRHTLWAVCCLCLLLLPAFTIGLPAWQPAVTKPLDSTLQSAPTKINFARETTSLLLRTTATNYKTPEPTISTSQWVLAILFACWLLGMMVVARKLLVGFVVAKHLSSRGIPVNQGQLWDEFTQCAESLNEGNSAPTKLPRLLLIEGEALQIPLTWGYRRPLVLMPSASLHWSSSCRRAALLHELSHIRRLDWLIQSLASLTCLLYWFHPLTWLASHRLRLESERATDDHVLTTGIKATDYSSSLLEIVRMVGSHHKSATSKDSLMKFAVPVSGTSKIEIRLLSILNPKQSRSAVTKKLLTGITLASFAAIVPLAAAKEPAEAQDTTEANTQTTPEQNTVRANPVRTLQGRIVKGFKFIGNNSLTDEDLKKVLVSKIDTLLDSSSLGPDGAAITKAYRDKGFDVYIKMAQQDETGIITYTLQEKRIITGFKFIGNKSLKDEDLQKVLTSKIGTPLARQNTSNDGWAIQNAYTQKGLSIQVSSSPIQDENGIVTYSLQENPIPLPLKTVTDSAFIHQRGYANYVTGVQPTLAGTPAPPRTVVGSTTIRTIEGQDPTVANSDRAVISRSFGHRRGYPGYISDGQTISAEKPGKTIAPPVILQTHTYVNESMVEAGNEGQPSIARMTHYDKESGKPAPWPAVIGFQFRGNKALQSDELQKLLVSKIGRPLEEKNVRADAAAIQKAYADKGLAVEVQQASLDEVGKVTYILLENRVITSFKFSGNKILSDDELQKVLVQRTGDLFGMQGMMADNRAINEAYSNKDVMLSVQNMTQDDSGVVFYTIHEAQPPKITQIKISGLAKTSEDSVRKLISTSANAKFNSAQLRRDLGHIFNTNLFTDATFKVDDDPNTKGSVIVTFLLKEK